MIDPSRRQFPWGEGGQWWGRWDGDLFRPTHGLLRALPLYHLAQPRGTDPTRIGEDLSVAVFRKGIRPRAGRAGHR